MQDTAQYLFYSDDPESLGPAVTEGILYDFQIVDAVVQRFLFYHYLPTGAGRCIALRAINLSDEPAVLDWRGSVPPASTAIQNCGHHATAGFLDALSAEWTSLAIAGRAQIIVLSDTILAGELFTGICEFRLTSGGPVKLSLVVARDQSRAFDVAAAGNGLPRDGFARIGKFDISDKTPVAVNVDAAVPSAPIRLGERLLANLDVASGGGPFKGEYAIVTHIVAHLANTTADPVEVALFESAHGGASTASYIIDGKRYESGTMECKDPAPPGYVPPIYKVNVYTIGGNATIATDIYTMPDLASSSPVVLTFAANDASINPGAANSVVQIGPPPAPARIA